MAIYRGPGGSGDATTDAASQATVATTKAAEAATSASAASSSATTAATEASNASTSASNSETAKTAAELAQVAAELAETNAETAQTNSETAQTAAELAETNAETAQTAAETAQTAAELAETNAATSETNSATSEANAATSAATAAAEAAAALAAFDNFDDKYLGAKASDPTLDNDGDALVAGALYFNTTSGVMNVYTGSTWVAAYVSAAGVLLQVNNLSDVASALTSRANLGLTIGTDVQAHSAVLDATTASYTTAEETKLSGIETAATADQTGAEIKTAYEAEANAFTDAQFTKLAGIETAATADQTAGEIKTAYESNADTNAFTDAEQTKLSGIEASADVTDVDNVTAAGALMDSELTSEASVKALNQGVATTDSPSFAGLTVDTDTLYVDSTNNRVGIGTSSPANSLETTGAIVAQGAATAYTNTGLYLQYKGSSVVDVAAWRSGASVAELSFSTDSGSDAAPVERMRIDSSGNVGIGTSSPSEKLEVYGTSPYIMINNTGETLGGIKFTDAQATGSQNAEIAFDSGSSNALRFSVNNAEAMRINSSGNVGIGTASPVKHLTISGASNGNITTLTDAATITPNLDSSDMFTVTLGGNRTLANPSNIDAGQTGSIFIVQDGTGSRTLAWGSYWDFAGGTAPTLSTAAGAVDRVDFIVRTSTSIHAVFTANYS